jgi:hypothetical protein
VNVFINESEKNCKMLEKQIRVQKRKNSKLTEKIVKFGGPLLLEKILQD